MWPWRKRKKRVAVCVECRWCRKALHVEWSMCVHPAHTEAGGINGITGERRSDVLALCGLKNFSGNCRKFEPSLNRELGIIDVGDPATVELGEPTWPAREAR